MFLFNGEVFPLTVSVISAIAIYITTFKKPSHCLATWVNTYLPLQRYPEMRLSTLVFLLSVSFYGFAVAANPVWTKVQRAIRPPEPVDSPPIITLPSQWDSSSAKADEEHETRDWKLFSNVYETLQEVLAHPDAKIRLWPDIGEPDTRFQRLRHATYSIDKGRPEFVAELDKLAPTGCRPRCYALETLYTLGEDDEIRYTFQLLELLEVENAKASTSRTAVLLWRDRIHAPYGDVRRVSLLAGTKLILFVVDNYVMTEEQVEAIWRNLDSHFKTFYGRKDMRSDLWPDEWEGHQYAGDTCTSRECVENWSWAYRQVARFYEKSTRTDHLALAGPSVDLLRRVTRANRG